MSTTPSKSSESEFVTKPVSLLGSLVSKNEEASKKKEQSPASSKLPKAD